MHRHVTIWIAALALAGCGDDSTTATTASDSSSSAGSNTSPTTSPTSAGTTAPTSAGSGSASGDTTAATTSPTSGATTSSTSAATTDATSASGDGSSAGSTFGDGATTTGDAGSSSGGGSSSTGGPMCAAMGMSCAAGETCCAGLMCCAGVPVPPGAEFCGAPCPISDRNRKENFDTVDPATVLEAVSQLPISTWNYKFESPAIRHIGPMAQDFMASFSLGATDKAIFTVDADGVALAAIQALHAQLKQAQEDKQALQQRVDDLEARLSALEAAR